jgi:hypothetical protein
VEGLGLEESLDCIKPIFWPIPEEIIQPAKHLFGVHGTLGDELRKAFSAFVQLHALGCDVTDPAFINRSAVKPVLSTGRDLSEVFANGFPDYLTRFAPEPVESALQIAIRRICCETLATSLSLSLASCRLLSISLSGASGGTSTNSSHFGRRWNSVPQDATGNLHGLTSP